MSETLPETVIFDTRLLLWLPLGVVGIIALIALPRLLRFFVDRFVSESVKQAYQTIGKPHENWLWLVFILAIIELVIFFIPKTPLFEILELAVSISLSLTTAWLGSRLFKEFFDSYLLDATVRSGRKVNSELFIVAKLAANFSVIVLVIIFFSQTHHINIVGIIASLGVGGLAVAFAAQKTLEQFLGGIVLYIDRPFVVDDYIGLPDGTFGRVESIGLRSTKVRTSGKGTLVVIPNSSLTQVNIENFTGAKKVISLIYLTFYRYIPEEERALIRQVILDCTHDIFGIDPRNTQVTFTEDIQDGNQAITQAQINFFILGSGEVSMDLRRQLLGIAKQNITQQLKEYGIAFDINDQTINVDSPITI